VTVDVARDLINTVPTLLYVHEISILQKALAEDEKLPDTLSRLEVWCGSELAAELIRPSQPSVAVVPYGLEATSSDPIKADALPLRIGVFATLVRRKGPDLAVEAIKQLPRAQRDLVALDLYGEFLDDDFGRDLLAALPSSARYHGILEPAAYRDALLACHAVLLPSRDDTLPLVSLDALGAGRVVMCTPTTGTAAYIDNGENGFVSTAADAEAISRMLADAISRRRDWPSIAERGRDVFERSFSRERFENHVLNTIDRLSTQRTS
jgi:glycosyltransferase involved in cell wall biosynthesis